MKKIFLLIAFPVLWIACTPINVFEKNIALPKFQWESSVRPAVTFDITDTASLYDLYVVLRHSDAYNYNNLWMNVYTQSPGDSVKKQSLELQLATNENGWLGTGMDDIFEHRIRITSAPVQFKKTGQYRFRFEQIMREDPLQHVLNVGLRIEKIR